MRFIKGLPVEFGINDYGLNPSCMLHEHADADARHVSVLCPGQNIFQDASCKILLDFPRHDIILSVYRSSCVDIEHFLHRLAITVPGNLLFILIMSLKAFNKWRRLRSRWIRTRKGRGMRRGHLHSRGPQCHQCSGRRHERAPPAHLHHRLPQQQ